MVVAVGLVVEDDLLGVRLDLSDFSKQNLHIALTAHQLSQWSGHITTGHQSRCHLIKQRLEQIEVAFVDQRDANVGFGQCLAGTNAGKPATHNHHVGSVTQTLFRRIQLEEVMLSSHGCTVDNLNSAYGC